MLKTNRTYLNVFALLWCMFPIWAMAQTGYYPQLPDSVRLQIRQQAYLLVSPDEVSLNQLDSLIQQNVPLAFRGSKSSTPKFDEYFRRVASVQKMVLVYSETRQKLANPQNILQITPEETVRISLPENSGVPANPDSLSIKKELLSVFFNLQPISDSLLLRLWETTGKLPNLIYANPSRLNEAARAVEFINKQPRIFGVVRSGNKLLPGVQWRDFPERVTNGYFSFPVVGDQTPPSAPYKAGFRFSPDIISLTPENRDKMKVYNGVKLDPELGLTDDFTFERKVRNRQRGNDPEIIVNQVRFMNDKLRGPCAYFSGQAYVDGGLMSRSSLASNFSITAWIKPTRHDNNNCILGKGKNFVLKIHRGLLTFTMAGIKDYFSQNSPVPSNQWTQVAVVLSGWGKRIDFYVNGQKTESVRLNAPYQESDNTLLLGSNLWEEFFVGYLGEVKIWDRELNEDEVCEQFENTKDPRPKQASRKFWIGIPFPVLVALWVVFLRRKRKKQDLSAQSLSLEKTRPMGKARAQISIPCGIYCFGGLKVVNQEGIDISQRFSPKIKQLFVAIFLHSIGEPKGISSTRLTEILWPGMSPQHAKNTRGTNIQNLKAALAPFPGIRLVFQNKLWVLEWPASCYSDYPDVLNRLGFLETELLPEAIEKELPGLLTVLKNGTLLPNMTESWVDPYVSKLSDRIIELGIRLFGLLDDKKHTSLLYELAEVMSLNDPLNEPVLRKKLQLLTAQGKLSLARTVYDNFVKLYHELYQEEYPVDFKNLTQYNA